VATQAQLGAIGVVAAQFTPEVDYRTPGRGGAGGAAVGVAKGVGLGVLGAAGCVLTYGTALPACGLAVVSPYLAVRYAVDQATEGVSPDTIAASETAITAVFAERSHQAAVQGEVVRVAVAQTGQPLVGLPGEGPRSAAETPRYTHLTAHGIDTVIEITLQRLALQSQTRAVEEGRNSWSNISAAELNPRLTVAVTARTRVLRTADGTVLYDYAGEYSGRGATFPDWGANDAQLLRDGLDQLFQEMARAIVAQVFGVASPPAIEPEAPAAPSPEQDRAPQAQPPTSDAERLGQEPQDALALHRQGNVVEAEAAFDTRLAARPGEVDVTVWKALALLEQARALKDAGESSERYKPLVHNAYAMIHPLGRTHVANPDWRLAMAKAFWLNDRPTRATKNANAALALRANFAEPHLLLGDIAYDRLLWPAATARTEYDKALAVPDLPAALQAEALYKLGKVAAGLDKKPGVAREYWERAVVADPTCRYGIMAQQRLKAAPASAPSSEE
jgi:tetratricopeptide (TPR) repeat protein